MGETTCGHPRALVQEIRAIRAALRSPREVPDALWPRTRNVARDGEEERTDAAQAAAKRLDALIAGLLANDKDISEFREMFRIALDPSGR